LIAHDNPGVIAPPPLVYLAGMVLGFGIEMLAPIRLSGSPAFLLVGWGLLALAMGLSAWGYATMRRAGTNIDPREPATTVVQSGPYRFSRNPLYLSLTLFQAGLGFLLRDPWMWVSLVFVLAIIRQGVVAREERYLEAKFGFEYLQYKSRVRRWL
jgi:protein-S-isoprenylcysteine O-methyltransferase Ste14